MTQSERQHLLATMNRWRDKFRHATDSNDPFVTFAAAADWLRAQVRFSATHTDPDPSSDWPDGKLYEAAMFISQIAGELRQETIEELGL